MKTKNNRGTLNENNIESASKIRLSQGCKYLKNIFAKGSPIVDAFHNGKLEKHESDALMFISEFAHKFGDTGNEPNEEYLNYLYDCAEIIYSISNKLGGQEGARIYCEIGRAMSNIKSYEECKKDEEMSFTENNKRQKKYKKNTVRLTENELKMIITESVKNILKEFVAGETDYNDSYNEYQTYNQTNGDIDAVMVDLHTICKYFNMIKDAMSQNKPLGNTPPATLKQLYYAVGTVYNFLSKHSNTTYNDGKTKMSFPLMRTEIVQALYKLCNMNLDSNFSNVKRAAQRAYTKIIQGSGNFEKLK